MTSQSHSEVTVVFGACSAIAQEWLELRACCGDAFFLVDTNEAKLNILAGHLRTKYFSQVKCAAANLTQVEVHDELLNNAFSGFGKPVNRVLIAYGFLGNQLEARTNWKLASEIINVNFTSCVALLTKIAPRMVAQKQGVIIALSSVAGDRGRASNYVYGAAKAGLTAFLSGLRASLCGDGVKVITIKPGMVDTPMTAHMKKGLLFSSPQTIAKAIIKAEKKRVQTVYAPCWWRYIMFIIIHIPERMFCKAKTL